MPTERFTETNCEIVARESVLTMGRTNLVLDGSGLYAIHQRGASVTSLIRSTGPDIPVATDPPTSFRPSTRRGRMDQRGGVQPEPGCISFPRADLPPRDHALVTGAGGGHARSRTSPSPHR